MANISCYRIKIWKIIKRKLITEKNFDRFCPLESGLKSASQLVSGKKGQEEASIFPFDKGEISDLYFLTMLTITLNQGQELKDEAFPAWPILAAFKEDVDFHSSPEN
jgi:hypothetical protein